MKIKVLVDALPLISTLTGIGRYTYEISKYLQSDDNLELNFFYGYYSKKLLGPSDKSGVKSLKSIVAKNKISKEIARELLSIFSRIFAPNYDVYWQPSFIPNKGIKAKNIVTSVHDFSFILYKDFHPKERIEYFENNFFQNIYNSDIIITGSEFTKQEILERLDFEEDKIKVIYHGVDHDLFKVYEDREVSYELPKKFIFSVGSIEPRKNLIGLLKAYEILDESLKKEYKLVLAGFKGWENKEIMDIINNNKENIHYLGYVSDIELVKTYNLASLFVYPSFYEGFGLPPLESMACGTPVITSNLSSIPEVCGDAVLYADPHNIEDIAKKIKVLINDENLQQELIRKGLSRVKRFTWEKSAQEHIEIIEELRK